MPECEFIQLELCPRLLGLTFLSGKSTVVALASQGAKVYMGARSEAKAMVTIAEIKAQIPSAQVLFLSIDLSSFKSVASAARKLSNDETSLHGLVNNAGIMGVPFSLTEDGYEIQFQVGSILPLFFSHAQDLTLNQDQLPVPLAPHVPSSPSPSIHRRQVS